MNARQAAIQAYGPRASGAATSRGTTMAYELRRLGYLPGFRLLYACCHRTSMLRKGICHVSSATHHTDPGQSIGNSLARFSPVLYLEIHPNFEWPVRHVDLGLNNQAYVIGDRAGRKGNDAAGAFRYRRGQFFPITIPGAAWLRSTGINEQRDAVGYYPEPCACGDESFNVHGFFRSGLDASITVLDYPDPRAFWTFLMGVNDLGQVVGQAAFGEETQGWLLDEGAFSILECMGGRETVVTDINNTGHVVGYAVRPGDGYTAGFIGTPK